MQEAGENWRKRAGFHRWRISWKTTSIKAVAGTRCSVHTPACRSVKTSKICRRIATTSRPKTNRSVPNRWIGWNCRRDFSLFIFCFIILFFFFKIIFFLSPPTPAPPPLLHTQWSIFNAINNHAPAPAPGPLLSPPTLLFLWVLLRHPQFRKAHDMQKEKKKLFVCFWMLWMYSWFDGYVSLSYFNNFLLLWLIFVVGNTKCLICGSFLHFLFPLFYVQI